LGYYLDHKETVEEYIRQQDADADEIRNAIQISQKVKA